jgi:pimeloyl-ACP methyl ester carboxylesterase
MVHGMGVDHRTMKGCMEPVFRNSSDQWQRIYFDLPGMGKTAGVDWITNSDGMLAFVLAFIEEVIPEQGFLLVGESYGCYLVRGVVRARPESVAGMLLICPLVVVDDALRDLPSPTVISRDPVLNDILDPEERDFMDLFLVNQTPKNWKRFRDEMLVGFDAGDQEFLAGIRGEVASYACSFDLDQALVSFEKPVLILTGRQDCLVGYRDAWMLVDFYPRASFAILDMAGHGLQIEQAVLFEALVNEWLDRTR